MAQWQGQFTGNSHATKVQDHEQLLKHAIEVIEGTSDDRKYAKERSARKLAAKVLNSRLKMIRAQIYNTEPVSSEDWGDKRVQIEHLKERETLLEREGVEGILREFGFFEYSNTES
ncbi:MAG: hypothetical protein KF685_10310 [Acidobacteria bacterium]|nr:hypothetical protein [Acidobacteriota bacterium]